jgi:hypothetical protein
VLPRAEIHRVMSLPSASTRPPSGRTKPTIM